MPVRAFLVHAKTHTANVHDGFIQQGFDLRLYGATRMNSQMPDPVESLGVGHTRDGAPQDRALTEGNLP